jgi:hypothetical protein
MNEFPRMIYYCVLRLACTHSLTPDTTDDDDRRLNMNRKREDDEASVVEEREWPKYGSRAPHPRFIHFGATLRPPPLPPAVLTHVDLLPPVPSYS